MDEDPNEELYQKEAPEEISHEEEPTPEETFPQETLSSRLLESPYFIYALGALVLVILASLLYAAIAIWSPLNSSRTNVSPEPAPTREVETAPTLVTEEPKENVVLVTNLTLLQKQPSSSICTFTHKTTQGENYFGTAYVRPTNELRVNLTSDEKSIHLLSLDSWGWYWTNGFSPEKTARFTDTTSIVEGAVISLKQTFTFTCEDWEATDSTFVPPASRNFEKLPGLELSK